MSSADRVVRFERSDETGAFVLVHVSHQGPALLDLTLTATEGESPYVSLVKQDRLKDLRAKSYQGSDTEWSDIVAFFLGQSPRSDRPDWATGLEASASLSSAGQNKTLVITIRKRVQTITQRLGALTLEQDDEQSIELFDWTGISVARANELEQHASSLASRCSLAESTIQRLTQQLDELIEAKAQHETQLTANFAHILNEKKLKIRNQQRLLTAATVNPAKVAEIQARIPAETTDAHGKSHPKRSAGSLSDTESSDGFEKMELDHPKSEKATVSGPDTDNDRQSTPPPPEEQITSSTDDDSSPEQPARPKRVAPKSETAPPPRMLPFAQRTRDTTRSNAPTAAKSDPEADAGETDDDEL